MSFFRGAYVIYLSFALKQLGTASSKYCVRSQLGQRTCWHRQRPRDRIQFGEAAVSVSWFVELVEFVFLLRTGKSWSVGSWCPVVSMSSEMTCVVLVSATPHQPHAAHQACVDVFISPMSKFSSTDFFHRIGAFPRFSVRRSQHHNSHKPERNFLGQQHREC